MHANQNGVDRTLLQPAQHHGRHHRTQHDNQPLDDDSAAHAQMAEQGEIGDAPGRGLAR